MATQYNGFKATDPVVRSIGNGFFEVFFCYYVPEKKVFRFKHGINSKPAKARKTAAEQSANVFREALKNGWNPSLQKLPPANTQQEPEEVITLSKALDFALAVKKKVLSKYSYYDYAGAVRFIKEAAKKTGHIHSDITTIKRADIKELLIKATEVYNWSANSRNKYLERLRSILSVLVDDEKIDFNPAFGIKDLPVEKTLGYKRLTNEEHETVAKILSNHTDYYEYVLMIYQLGVRRSELLTIRLWDIDFSRKEIIIRASGAKMNCERILPITNDVMQILLRRDVRGLNRSWYLFSKGFKPGETPLHPNTPTSWWKKLIIAAGIDCKMYSLKHKGADDYIKAGVDIDVLKTLYGHKSKQMTEVYARAVKEKYKEKIIEYSPQFGKPVLKVV